MEKKDEEEVSKLECKFHGDLKLPKNPTTFRDAVQVFKHLSDLLKGEDGPIAVPKKVWLHPLTNLNSVAAKIVHEISIGLVSHAQKLMEELFDYEMQCNDLKETESCSSFSGLQAHVSRFKGMISQYKMEISRKLAQLLPTIREGGTEESQLAEVFKSKEASPFSTHHLETWLKDKTSEVKILGQYFQSLREVPCIKFAFMPGDLDEIVNNLKYEYIVCFTFCMLTSDDVALSQMQAYLDKPQCSGQLSPVNPWFKNAGILAALRQHVIHFTTFAKANNERTGVKFVVTDCSDEIAGGGSSIRLFQNGKSKKFNLPVHPDNVRMSPGGITSTSIRFEWSTPEHGSEIVQYYTVRYGLRSELVQNRKTKKTTSCATNITLDGLQSGKDYCIEVRSECKAGVSKYSRVSDPVRTLPPRLAVVLKKVSAPIPNESGPPAVYKLIGEKIDLPGKMLCKVFIGKPIQGVQEKVLMVVGATGAGKTTLINSMVNYILGVKWKDDFRFKLITEEPKSQAHSQTNAVTAYTIHRMDGSRVDYNLTIIDTPGFGDTSGLKQDTLITEQIKEFFSITGRNGISHLNGIGFVTQSALPRLTPTQQYIFDSILSIFGKDVAKNIFMMVTFADDRYPPVMSAIEAAQIPHSGFFKFYNSALFAESSLPTEDDDDDEEDNFDEKFWKMGVNSFKFFFTAFQVAENVSLTMIKDVLQTRERLQTIVIGLQHQMQACLAEMETLCHEKTALEAHKADIIANKDFTVEISEPSYDVVKLPPRYVMVHKTVVKTSDDLKKKFECASTGKAAVEGMIAGHNRQLEEAHAQLHEMIDEAQQCLAKLDKIALKPNPLTQVEYIQLLINSEEKQGKEGWLDRVKYLETTKEQASLLAVMKDSHVADQRIEEAKLKKEPSWEKRVETFEKVKRIKARIETIQKGREPECIVI